MDCGGAIFNSMVGIPITKGLESFEKASIHLLKEDSGPSRLNSNPEVHDVSKRVFIQDLISLFQKVFKFKAYPLRERTKYS